MVKLIREVRSACRRLVRSPAYTITVIAVLGAGIAANVAMFVVANGLLLRPMPYADSERLVALAEVNQRTGRRIPVSYPDFRDWQTHVRQVAEMAAYSGTAFTVQSSGLTEVLNGELVSLNYFDTLGVSMAFGRGFSREAPAPEAVISHALWQRQWAGSPTAIGGAIVVNDQPVTVVGVMGPQFRAVSREADIWLPIDLAPTFKPEMAALKVLETRQVRWHQVVGRLRADASLEQARGELENLAAELQQRNAVNKDIGIAITEARNEWVGDLRGQVFLLSAAVLLVLICACANIATLMTIRGVANAPQIAVRKALGADSRRLIRESLAESLVLSAAGGTLGLFGAWLVTGLVGRMAPVEMPSFASFGIDGSVVVFTVAACLLTVLIFGVAPAWRVSRIEAADILKDRHWRGGPRQRLLMKGFVVSELALATVLLIGSGLLAKSLVNAQAVDLGFAPANQLTARVEFPNRPGDGGERMAALYTSLIEQMSGLSTHGTAALASHLYLTSQFVRGPVLTPDMTAGANDEAMAMFYRVTPGFFEAMQVPLVRGRDFSASEGPDTQPVAVVSGALAQTLWPQQDPIGQQLKAPALAGDTWLTVVGVAGDTRHAGPIDGTPQPSMYVALAQYPAFRVAVIIPNPDRSSRAAANLNDRIGRVSHGIGVWDAATMTERLSRLLDYRRSSATLVAAFAIAALGLAAVGIFGVTAHSVRSRRREIGLRMALGARGAQVLRMVLGEAAGLALAGSAIGVLAAVAVARALSHQLYAVEPGDLATYLRVGALIAGSVLVATGVPVYRATLIDPQQVLRGE